MAIRPTGFSFPFGGIAWEYTETVEQRIQQLFHFLESRRLLTNAYALEVPSQCVQSAIEIREALVSITEGIKFNEEDVLVLDMMIDACNKLLDDLNKVQGITPYVHIGNSLFDVAIMNYRDSIKNGVVYFSRNYNIRFKKEININGFYEKYQL